MLDVNDKECLAAGLDPAKVMSIARRLSQAALDAERLGMMVFGGSSTGTLRFNDRKRNEYGVEIGDLIVAHLDGMIDGGAGDEKDWGDGLLRGE